MPHWKTMIEKDFMGAWDLVDQRTGKPREYTLKIAAVKSEGLQTRGNSKKKRKVVIRFERAQKGFVANTTNCETIESMYGSDTDGWIGKSITLYQGEARSPETGKMVPAIRVRSKRPTAPAEEIQPQPVDPEMRAAQDEAFGRDEGREPGSDG